MQAALGAGVTVLVAALAVFATGERARSYGGAGEEPVPPISMQEDLVAMAVARAYEQGGQFEVAEVIAIAELVGWPRELQDEVLTIAWCESKYSPFAIGDSGQSLGVMQLWRGWFAPGEDPMNPVTNLAVALRVYEKRGRFGGGGGWSCADRFGIP